MIRVAIVVANRIEKCPYVWNYIKILKREQIAYDFICWNRENKNINNIDNITFNYFSPESNKLPRKLFDYWKYKKFVNKVLGKGKYDYIIVHDIVLAVFLFGVLKCYKYKYIFDIRDYSPIYPYTKFIIKTIVHNSLFTTISSPGYLQWLPKNIEYVLDHNISDIPSDSFIIEKNYRKDLKRINGLTILTIGQIRDFSANSKLIDALANKPNIKLLFAGNGIEKERLEKYANKVANNAEFLGEYKKMDEQKIVNSADVMNILLPKGIAFDTPLSNRFYLALLLKKPIITNKDNLHADYVTNYGLGIVVDSLDNVHDDLFNYFQNLNYEEFVERCNIILKQIQIDKNNFENVLTRGIKASDSKNAIPNL